MAKIDSYFVSDPGGFDLPGTYPSMAEAEAVASELNAEIEQEREHAGRDPQEGGRYATGAVLEDGAVTFEIG